MLRDFVKGLVALGRSSDELAYAAVNSHRRQVAQYLLQRAAIEENADARHAFLEASRVVADYPAVTPLANLYGGKSD